MLIKNIVIESNLKPNGVVVLRILFFRHTNLSPKTHNLHDLYEYLLPMIDWHVFCLWIVFTKFSNW